MSSNKTKKILSVVFLIICIGVFIGLCIFLFIELKNNPNLITSNEITYASAFASLFFITSLILTYVTIKTFKKSKKEKEQEFSEFK